MSKFKADPDEVRICGEIIEKAEDCFMPSEFMRLADAWEKEMLEYCESHGLLTPLDRDRIRNAKVLTRDMAYYNYLKTKYNQFPENETGIKEHPAGAAWRAAQNLKEKFIDKMQARVADLPAGGKATHGNSKKDNNILKIIN